MIELDLRTLLPKTRAAFDAGELQAQKAVPGTNMCLYEGPCAIGVGLTPRQQTDLDSAPIRGGTGIDNLTARGFVKVPPSQGDDFKSLQVAHDSWVTVKGGSKELFEQTLTELEVKYCLR